MRARFLWEARALANLSTRGIPNIPNLYEVGEHEGRLYQARELIEGSTFEQLVVSGAVELPEGIRMLSIVAKAVHQVHLAGFVHRNLLLSNVLVAIDQTPKLIGFGSVDVLAGSRWTRAGSAGVPIDDDLQGLGRMLACLAKASRFPVPAKLEAICTRCRMAKSAGGYRSAAKLADDLSTC